MKTAAVLAAALAAVAARGAGIDAEYVSTSTRTLADGNTVEHEFLGRFAQDDEGRTRFEIQGRVDIMDPVAGVRWSANTALGRAFRSELPAGWNETVDPSSDVAVVRIGDEAHVPDVPEIPQFPRPDVTDLGTATVNGLVTVGMRYRHTIPAGAMGNKEPVVVETDVWRSREFGFDLPIKTEVDDPFNGRSVQELRNIRILEPGEGADLFRPDPGWTVVEAPAQMHETLRALPER